MTISQVKCELISTQTVSLKWSVVDVIFDDLAGYFLNSLTRECVPCSFCYPDHPGLTLPVKQCAVRGQPALYRCLPVAHPPLPGHQRSTTTRTPPPDRSVPAEVRHSRGDRLRRRHRRHRRRRLRRRRPRAGQVAARSRNDAEEMSTASSQPNEREPAADG